VIFSGFLVYLNYIRHYEYDFIPNCVNVKVKLIRKAPGELPAGSLL